VGCSNFYGCVVSAHKAIQAGTLGKMKLVKMLTPKIFAGAYWQDYRWFTAQKLEERYDQIKRLIDSASSNAEAITRVALNLLTVDGAETIAHIECIPDALSSVLV
jgi:hypothetical protein